MESLLYAALSLPPALGGLGLPRPELNQPLSLGDLQHLILNHVECITPDLLWREFLLVLEYLGELPHNSRQAQHEDANRMQDYPLLGYQALPVRREHVSNQTELNRLATRIATLMDQRGAHGMRAWVDELRADSEFLALQRILLMVMLPAVHDR